MKISLEKVAFSREISYIANNRKVAILNYIWLLFE